MQNFVVIESNNILPSVFFESIEITKFSRFFLFTTKSAKGVVQNMAILRASKF